MIGEKYPLGNPFNLKRLGGSVACGKSNERSQKGGG